jgi:hypothetical protein
MNALPDGLIRQKIDLFASEAAEREFTRTKVPGGTDSEVLRKGFLLLEQLVEDSKLNVKLTIHPRDGEPILVTPELFFDPPDAQGPIISRDVIFHKDAKSRIDVLCLGLGGKDISAVARCAERFLHRIAQEVENGSQFFAETKGEPPREVFFNELFELFGLSPKSPKTFFAAMREFLRPEA